MTRMQKDEWRADRDQMEITAALVGGDATQYASAAGNALRSWVQLMQKRPGAASDDEANELWKESVARLKTARWALEQLQGVRVVVP